MSLLTFRRTIRSSQRLANILTVLARHGFGHLVVGLRLERLIPFRHKFSHKVPTRAVTPEELMNTAERLARALEDLGPTFVKLGQGLAARPDLLPMEFQLAFRRLNDQVRPFPVDEVREQVQHDLGAPFEELYRDFDPQPFASGSIGQAHYATTHDGEKVVVKVKRPGIDRLVTQDISLLNTLAQLIEKHIPEYRIYRPIMIVEEFERTMRRELDFVTEASLTAQFRKAFADWPQITTPEVFWNLSSRNVLTLERLEGVTVSAGMDYEALGIDRRQLARNMLDAFFYQFFELGLFHADPHPGNLLALAPARLAIIDFGQVGRLDPTMRSQLALCLIAAANRELDLVIDIFEDLGTLPLEVDRNQLKSDLATLLDKYYGTPIKRINIGAVFEAVVELARQHHIFLPRDFVLIGKSMTSIGGVALMLDPETSPVEVIKPRLNRLLLEQLSPKRLARNLGANAYHLVSFLQQLPHVVRRLTRNLTQGQMRLIFKHEGLENLIFELDRSSNRIAFSVITASIILGSSIIMLAKVGPTFYGIPWLGLVGFVMAGISGVWLVASIFRSGRL